MTLHEQHPESYAALRPLFADTPFALVLESLLSGNSRGRVWAAEGVQSVFMWDEGYNLYLLGEADEGFGEEVAKLFQNTLRPEALGRGLGIFKLNYGAAWEGKLEPLFPPPLTRRERVLFRHEGAPLPHPQPLPEGFHIRQIDEGLLSEGLEHLDALEKEITGMWPSLERFLSQGFGFCVLYENSLAGWCTAEYVSEGHCGVGIETVDAYQGQGVATAVAQAFVDYALRQGITPYWDSWKTNLPSVRVAEKVGFRQGLEYPILLGRYA